STGVMARTPLCPISSAASIKSLLVTPSSFARSITLIFAAATAPSPPGGVGRAFWLVPRPPVGSISTRQRRGSAVTLQYGDRDVRRHAARLSQRMSQPAPLDGALHALGGRAHVRAAAGRTVSGVDRHHAVRVAHEPHERELRSPLATPDTRPDGRGRHVVRGSPSSDVVGPGVGSVGSAAGSGSGAAVRASIQRRAAAN